MTLKSLFLFLFLFLVAYPDINNTYAYSIEEFTYERFAPAIFPDDDQVTTEELKAVADIFNEIDKIKEEAEEKTVEILQSKGLEMEDYDRFISWKQDSVKQHEMTKPEIEALQKANDEIQEMRSKYDSKVTEVIEKHGLTHDRYRDIQTELQNDAELREEFLKYWNKPSSTQNKQNITSQYEFTSAEFITFANIMAEIEVLLNQYENTRNAIIEDSMLETEQYQNMIIEEEQAENREPEVSELKKQEFESVRKEIKALEADFRDDTIELMNEKGMEFKRFREIQEAIQNSPELQKKLMQHLD